MDTKIAVIIGLCITVIVTIIVYLLTKKPKAAQTPSHSIGEAKAWGSMLKANECIRDPRNFNCDSRGYVPTNSSKCGFDSVKGFTPYCCRDQALYYDSTFRNKPFPCPP